MKYLIITIPLLIFISACSTEKVSLSDYPNIFIKDDMFTARLVVPPTANGIILGGSFAAEIVILKYKSNINYKTPLTLTSIETLDKDENGKMINEQDLIIVGDPCQPEIEILSERYSCQLWKQKTHDFEFFIEKNNDSHRLYALFRNDAENKNKVREFVSDYISFNKKFQIQESRICFSSNQQQVECN